MDRGKTTLHRGAGVPVLLVGDVPEVHGVGGIEAGLLDGFGGEGPGAFDAGRIGGQRCEAVGHHVVGMEAHQDVGEDVHVDDGAPGGRIEPPEHDATTGTVERHGLHALTEVHGPAHPCPLRVVVVPALGRADLAQLGVDHRAVVALVVVLGEDLPVGRDHVFVAAGHPQPLRFVGGDHRVEGGQRLVERRRPTRSVDEDQAVPFGDRQFGEPELRRLEAFELLEPRRRPHLALQGVRPRVIGADHPAVAGGHPAGEQFVAPVAADVGKAPQHPVLGAGQEHAGRAQ